MNTPNLPVGPLIVLGAGPHQIPYLKRCKELGIRTLSIDSNPSAAGRKYSSAFLSLDISNTNSQHIVNQLVSMFPSSPPIGVLCAGVELPILASAISAKFGLTFVSELTAQQCTDKFLRKKTLKRKGVPTPSFKIALMGDDSYLPNFPIIIKKRSGSGARDVSLVKNLQEFKRHTNNTSFTSDVMFEEYEIGKEFSIEAFIWKGQFHYYCFAERNFEVNPKGSFIEWGSISDPNYDPNIICEVKKTFEDGCAALGLVSGPAKGDIIYSHKGAQIIEIASRSAPLAPLIAKQVYGFDAINAQIFWAIGKDPFERAKPPVTYSKSLPVSHRMFKHRKGKVSKIEGLKKAEKSRGVLLVMNLIGDILPSDTLEEISNTNRLFYVAATGDNAVEARANADYALKKIKLSYDYR